MSKVYAVQVPAYRDRVSRLWVDKYDLEPAREFGELVRVLGHGNVPEDPRPTREALELALTHFDPDEDFLLMLGDPVACAQAVHVLASEFGLASFRVLKWDRRERRYHPYLVG